MHRCGSPGEHLETAELGAGFRTSLKSGLPEAQFVDWLRSPTPRKPCDDVPRKGVIPVAAEHSIFGYVYDVKSGKLGEIEKATQAGRAT